MVMNTTATALRNDCIRMRGVAVHNLQHVDVDIPLRQLVVICGVSGSGKTSLALDTLYAEGQRRYIESFSAYTRQFLERLEKPAAESIENIPPAIAVTRSDPSRSNRSTVGTATETLDYLRLLYARIGRTFCPDCGLEVRGYSPQTLAEEIQCLPAGHRFQIGFQVDTAGGVIEAVKALREQGFVRVLYAERTWAIGDLEAELAERSSSSTQKHEEGLNNTVWVVVDRLVTGQAASARLRDSFELALRHGHGHCAVWLAETAFQQAVGAAWRAAGWQTVDGYRWCVRRFFQDRICSCGRTFPVLEPRLFSFNSPLGACPVCEGFGNIVDIDMDLVVPDPNKSLRQGAIAPWNCPAYAHELEELLELAPDYGIPVDVPYCQLTEEQRALIREGVPERDFGGLKGFFRWLERRKYKMHLRVFLSRWRSYQPCPGCGGARLRPEALAVRIGGKNFAEVTAMRIRDALEFFQQLSLEDSERVVARTMLDQIQARLHYLNAVGLGYLSLDRPLRTLSGGEAQRVALTSALGSALVNMLYVLDEPSVGLHPSDVARLLNALRALQRRGNTVVVIEHEEDILRAADYLIELGPGAGRRGGRVVFAGKLSEMLCSKESLTGAFLSGKRGVSVPETRREPRQGWIRLVGARGHNLKNITVDFPLGLLCLVTGVSGAGKSTLVEETLYPALCRRLRKEGPKPLPYEDVVGDGQIDDVVLVDPSPIARSPRSNPVTAVRAFDAIRDIFAETTEAKLRNFGPAHFSFNCPEGRCPECEGAGYLEIDMQFLADVHMKCPLCQGRRFRKEVLDVRYRDRNIAEVLDMTVREACSFFRGHAKLLARLKALIDVGLDYLCLGQPANTLSGGESQRLKLATYLVSAKRKRTLFLLDEPTTGLHFADIVQLLDCFESLLRAGHSLIIVEHNVQMMKAADYLIDLGPGAGDEGGRVVVAGTPEEVARCPESITGRFLAAALDKAHNRPATKPVAKHAR
ncbi:MAG: UvrABC system protein A [Pirellulaceae bacterium]|nr:MAG: UvrABC system protein A [Pirellulaceae bacterium]